MICKRQRVHLPMKLSDQEGIWLIITCKILHEHVFPLIRFDELTTITDAYQWNADDHLE